VFIGHLALGFAAKRAAPKVSLGTLLLATQLVDMVFPIFVLLGIEHARIVPGITAVTPLDLYDYPWTHSLLAGVVWGLVFAAMWYTRKRDPKTALLLAALVVEGAMFAAGVGLYLRSTRALDKTGRYALWALIGFLVLVYVLNLTSPPPPSIEAVAWVGQAGWLLLLWAVWADRHRAVD
jgi:uncharacterized membrane protein (UPF0136 family)